MSYNPPPPPLGGSDPYGAAGQGQWGGGGAPGQWAGGYGGPPGQPPNNNMTMAIIALVSGVLCCTPGIIPGVVALVKASQVKDKWARGDAQGAHDAAKAARTWSIVAYVGAVIGLVLIGVLIATGAFEADTTTS